MKAAIILSTLAIAASLTYGAGKQIGYVTDTPESTIEHIQVNSEDSQKVTIDNDGNIVPYVPAEEVSIPEKEEPEIEETEVIEPVQVEEHAEVEQTQHVSTQESSQTVQSAPQGPVIAHSDTDRNYCDEYGCYDAYGDYRAKDACTVYTEPSYEVSSSLDYDGMSWSAQADNSGEVYYTSQAPVWIPHEASGFEGQRISIGNYTAVLHYTFFNQAVVDARDSAEAVNFGGKVVLADHATQGFSAIVNNTVAYIGGQRYHRVSCYKGYNNGDLVLTDGTRVADMPDSWLVMYTCNGHGGYNIWVTFWAEG